MSSSASGSAGLTKRDEFSVRHLLAPSPWGPKGVVILTSPANGSCPRRRLREIPVPGLHLGRVHRSSLGEAAVCLLRPLDQHTLDGGRRRSPRESAATEPVERANVCARPCAPCGRSARPGPAQLGDCRRAIGRSGRQVPARRRTTMSPPGVRPRPWPRSSPSATSTSPIAGRSTTRR